MTIRSLIPPLTRLTSLTRLASLTQLASFVALVALTTLPTTTHAQTSRGNAVWSGLLATQELTAATPGPSLWLDVHGRREEQGTNVLVRPGVGLRVLPWLSLWAGYAWTPSFADGGDEVFHEHRVWEQIILSHAFGPGLSVQARTRFEQRFGEGSDEVAHRFRQFARLSWMHPSQPIGLVVWDELFVGLRGATWGAASRYDQNRLFVGPIFRVAPWARVEPGYLFVHLDRDTDRVVHAVAVNLFLTGAR